MKNTKQFTLIITLILTLFFGSVLTPQVALASPKISNSKITLTVGHSQCLHMTGVSKSVKWSSNKTSVATVTTKGKVSAKKKGTAIITAKVGNKKYTCKVTVKSPVTYVYLTRTGECYHITNHCGRTNPKYTTKVTISYARSHGYRACSKCF